VTQLVYCPCLTCGPFFDGPCCASLIGLLDANQPQAIGTESCVSTRCTGYIQALCACVLRIGECVELSSCLPTLNQKSAAAKTTLCVANREESQRAPTPPAQHNRREDRAAQGSSVKDAAQRNARRNGLFGNGQRHADPSGRLFGQQTPSGW